MTQITNLSSINLTTASAILDGIQFNSIIKVGLNSGARYVEANTPWKTQRASDAMQYAINAVDIDWNDAVSTSLGFTSSSPLKTTGQLLKKLESINELVQTKLSSDFAATLGATTSTSNIVNLEANKKYVLNIAGKEIKFKTPADIYGSDGQTYGVAGSTTLGLIKTGYTNNGDNKKVQVDSSGDAYVNISHSHSGYQPTGNYAQSITLNGETYNTSSSGNINLGTVSNITYIGMDQATLKSYLKDIFYAGHNIEIVGGDELDTVVDPFDSHKKLSDTYGGKVRNDQILILNTYYDLVDARINLNLKYKKGTKKITFSQYTKLGAGQDIKLPDSVNEKEYTLIRWYANENFTDEGYAPGDIYTTPNHNETMTINLWGKCLAKQVSSIKWEETNEVSGTISSIDLGNISLIYDNGTNSTITYDTSSVELYQNRSCITPFDLNNVAAGTYHIWAKYTIDGQQYITTSYKKVIIISDKSNITVTTNGSYASTLAYGGTTEIAFETNTNAKVTFINQTGTGWTARLVTNGQFNANAIYGTVEGDFGTSHLIKVTNNATGRGQSINNSDIKITAEPQDENNYNPLGETQIMQYPIVLEPAEPSAQTTYFSIGTTEVTSSNYTVANDATTTIPTTMEYSARVKNYYYILIPSTKTMTIVDKGTNSPINITEQTSAGINDHKLYKTNGALNVGGTVVITLS